MSHHAEPGNIFKTKDGTKMTDEVLNEEEMFAIAVDAEGNIEIMKAV